MDGNAIGDEHECTATPQPMQQVNANGSAVHIIEHEERLIENDIGIANDTEALALSGAQKSIALGESGSNASDVSFINEVDAFDNLTLASGMDRKDALGDEDKTKVEFDPNSTELLGSVIMHNCYGTRTSARVIQKMKQDQTRPTTPPLNERENKRDEKNAQKTPSQMRANKATWSNVERNHFFDALNEFGKDFDAIGSYINSKLKRKSATDVSFKSKDQVRQQYYQTYHKICKYIKFSEEIKKPAQELYALINYGEMRRKLQFVTDKHFMKLRNLVYQGHITVRCKGKNLRVKTPSCKALRRLNQLDDSLEDIRLPSKIEVIVSPMNMDAFGRVQTIAQNPRVRTTVPLHKKLVNFIKTFQYKWRSPEAKLVEEATRMFAIPTQITNPSSVDPNGVATEPAVACSFHDGEMCFLPKPGVTIHRPLLSITEYLSSMNICLTAYEERMGLKVRSETLNPDRGMNTKRQRSDSGSEKRSPDCKKNKMLISGIEKYDDSVTEENLKEEQSKSESSGDELHEEMTDLLTDGDMMSANDELTFNDLVKNDTMTYNSASSSMSFFSGEFPHTSIASTTTMCSSAVAAANAARAKRNPTVPAKSVNRAAPTFKPLLNDEVFARIRKGWTISNAADITIGDLYVVLGQDSRLELEYYWLDNGAAMSATTIPMSMPRIPEYAGDATTVGMFTQKQNGLPYNPLECDDPMLLKTLSTSFVGNKLKHLLLIANLSERIRKRQQCSCGHTCERTAIRTKIERDLATKTFVSPKSFASTSNAEMNSVFRQPVAPVRRPIFGIEAVKQTAAFTRAKMSRQVLVQRQLMPGGSNNSYDLLDVKHLQNHLSDEQQEAEADRETETDRESEVASTTSAAADYDKDNEMATSSASSITSAAEEDASDDHFEHSHECTTRAAAPTEPKSPTSNHSQLESEEICLPSSTLPGENAYDENSTASLFNGLMSPMQLLRETSSNSRWLEENLNDYSLTSLLGHLDEINASRDILDPSSNLSVISESSVDYRHKFQEITALMQSQDKD